MMYTEEQKQFVVAKESFKKSMWAVSFQCMTKSTTNKKKKRNQCGRFSKVNGMDASIGPTKQD